MKYRGLLVASAISLAILVPHAAAGEHNSPVVNAPAENRATMLLVEAVDALREGRAGKAERLLTRALDRGGLDAELMASALVNRALARQRQGRDEEAIRDYTAALKIDALSGHARAVALYNRGLAHRRLGRDARAAEDFTSAIYLDPGFAAAYFSRGNVLFRAGQNLFALADYEKALKYGYDKPHLAHYALALVNLALDRRDEARKQLRMALAKNPDYAPARRQLAALLKAEGTTFAALPPEGGAGSERTSPAARRLAEAAGRNHTNLRRRARPQPVAPGEPPAPARKAPVRPVAGTMMTASAKNPSTNAGHAATSRRAKAAPAATIRTAARAGAGTGAGVLSDTLRPEDVRVMPVSAPARVQNIHAKSVPSPERAERRPLFTASLSAPAAGTKGADRASADARNEGNRAATATWRGWAIQLASQPSEEAAWKHWKKLERRVRRVVRKARPVVMKAEIAGKGTFYRLRLVGFEERKAPRRLCGRLKRRGVSCYVTRAGS
jgi:tetratricopeptide (TPR) repeat protein